MAFSQRVIRSSLRLTARGVPSISAATRRLRPATFVTLSSRARLLATPSSSRVLLPSASSVRCFQTESEYHDAADETLEEIQDALDDLFEENPQPPHEIEVNFSSGVLTIGLPPHGTWVLNKQTPNQQIWWSSPLSGPRRYEYSDDGDWVFTRSDTTITLGDTLKDEIKELYQLDLDLNEVR
jgi:frataxin